MHGIHLENSPACGPQSNGAAERLIQEHWNRSRKLIFESNLRKKLSGSPCSSLIGSEIDYPPKELRMKFLYYYGILIQELISAEYLNLEQNFSRMRIEVILHRIRNSYQGQF